MYINKVVSGILLLFISCNKSDFQSDIPECVKNGIKSKNPIEVWDRKVDGKTYYYFESQCCDQFNVLYDEKCHVICAPNGGITGSGDGNCPEFIGEIEKTLVWENDQQ
jgi:hypothetical protein